MLQSWGFNGYRTTDGDGINGMNTPSRQNYTATPEDSISLAMRDGQSDIDDGNTYRTHLASAVEQGKIDAADVRRALANVFRTRFRLGLFDPIETQPYLDLGKADINNAEARRINRDAARQSLVLLQNRRATLPLRDRQITTVQDYHNRPLMSVGIPCCCNADYDIDVHDAIIA